MNPASPFRHRVACIGECMVELRERPDGTLGRAHGGDTLNTAVYLARLGVDVSYVTALGDDPLSDEMVAAWQLEGINTELVLRLPGRLPGLYMIQTDAAGERRFLYWRDSAAARSLLAEMDPARLRRFDVLYYSGITLSIFDERSRARLAAEMVEARSRGVQVAFDTNFRARGWPDLGAARRLYRQAFASASIILASEEDLEPLFGDDAAAELARHAETSEQVLKLRQPGSRIRHAGAEHAVSAAPVPRVTDTTAAGDSFAAAYLASRLAGAAPAAAAASGHALAGTVVRYPGAIIPRSAMPPQEPT